MEPHILLAQLRGALERAPSFDDYAPTSANHQAWLGQVHALVTRWNSTEALSFKTAADFLGLQLTRDNNLAKLFGVINRAVADLELRLPAGQGQAFGPGAIYDFFKALNAVISAAQKRLLIIDPYLDDTVFDAYLSGVQGGIQVRLLVEEYAAKLKPAVARFTAQHHVAAEVRRSKAFHDRVKLLIRVSAGYWVNQFEKLRSRSQHTWRHYPPTSPR